MLLALRSTSRFLTVMAVAALTATAAAQDTARDTAAKRLETEHQRQARMTLIRITIEETIAAGDAALAKLDQLKTDTDNFNRRLRELMESDEGRRIAQDDAVLLTFRKRVYDQGPASLDDFEVRSKAVETVVATLQADLSKLTDAYVLSPGFAETIEKHSQWASERRALLARRAAALKACLAATPPITEGQSLPTLKEAIDKRGAEEFREIAKIYDEVAKETHPQKEALLRDTLRTGEIEKGKEEATAIRLKYEAQIEALKKEHALKLAQLDKERDELKQTLEHLTAERETKQNAHQRDMDKQRLEEKCKDPKVQQLLAPFITPGYWQPTTGNVAGGRRSTEKAGVSLKVLTDAGALVPGDDGVILLIKAACSSKNDRPTWGVKIANETRQALLRRMTPAQIENAKEAQALLRELGPTLVELGKLSE